VPPSPSEDRRADEARHPRTAGWRFTVPVRSFRGASSRRNAVAGADGSYIGGGSIRCQREKSKFFTYIRDCAPIQRSRELSPIKYLVPARLSFNAQQKPYSCDLLTAELIRGVIAFGGALLPSSHSPISAALPRVIDVTWASRHLVGPVGGRFSDLTDCAGGLRFGSQAGARQFAIEA
jgi:hypothetical protein